MFVVIGYPLHPIFTPFCGIARVYLRDHSSTCSCSQTTTYTWSGTQQTSKAVANTGSTTVTQTMSYGLLGQMSKLITENKDGSGNVTSRTQVEYRYDNSGIRFVAVDTTDGTPTTPTVDGTQSGRTEYLIDHDNFTGYAQTIIETKYSILGTTERISYTFGADEITQTVTALTSGGSVSGTPVTSVFGHDGHGSVRALYAAAAAFAQVYSYSAYGELMAIHNATAGIVSGGPAALADASAASTRMLYNGEGLDTRTGLYNFRARWYSASNARFERLDPFAGNPNDPFSFNKYGFVHGDPVMASDPSGEVIVFVHGIANHNGSEVRQITRTLNRMWDAGSQRRQEIIHFYHGIGNDLDNLDSRHAGGERGTFKTQTEGKN